MIEILAQTDTALLIVWGVLIAGVLALIPVAVIVSRVYPYSYPNARVRAMKAKMVSSEQLIELSSRSYNDIILQLEEHYPNLTKHYAADLSFANLELALRNHLIAQLEKVKRISPREVSDFIKAMLAKYDIVVIETVARSLATSGTITSDVLHKTELFSKEFITQKEHSLEDLREELKETPYEEIINKHYQDIKDNKLKAFEQELDLLYFKKLLSKAQHPSSRGYVKRLIDAHNIAQANKDEEVMIPGGKIPQQKLQTAKTIKARCELAKEYGYPITTKNDSQILERDMQKAIKKYSQEQLKKEPLSPSSIIGYVGLLIVSVRNTIIVLKMKHHDMSTQRIREVIA